MNNKILIGIIIITVITLIFTLIKFINPSDSKKELELTYKKSAGIPYVWKYEIEDDSIVEFVRSYVLKDENVGAISGAPVYTNYVFKGKKTGTTTITFKLVSIADPDEHDVMEEDKNIVKVDENNNITLVTENK